MGAAERVHAREAAVQSMVRAHKTVHLERLLAYADTWRRYAHEWTEQAKTCAPKQVEPLRTRAQLALYAAHEADEQFRMHQRRLIRPPLTAPHADRAMPGRVNAYVVPVASGGHRIARTPSRSRARNMARI